MKTFNYKILKGSTVVLKNTIHSETRAEALSKLESVKVELDGTDIKLTDVNPVSNWSC